MARPFDKTCDVCGAKASYAYQFTPRSEQPITYLCARHYKSLVTDYQKDLKKEVRK